MNICSFTKNYLKTDFVYVDVAIQICHVQIVVEVNVVLFYSKVT